MAKALTNKVTAKALADAVNTQRTADRKAGKGKATYSVTTEQMTPIAKALNGKAMPTETFTGGSANDRRVWCEQNGARLLVFADAELPAELLAGVKAAARDDLLVARDGAGPADLTRQLVERVLPLLTP